MDGYRLVISYATTAMGGTELRVTGTGFINTPDLTARFYGDDIPDQIVKCTFVSSTELLVLVPPNPNGNSAGFVKVTVGNNGHRGRGTDAC
jgi:hypothetical protein